MKDKRINKEAAIVLMNDNKSVFVSGSFDLVHLGHMRFLDKAKQLVGNDGILVVAVLGNETIQTRKGDGRPVFNLAERSEYLSYLESVDYVVPWSHPWEQLREFVLSAKPTFLAVVEGDSGMENKREFIERAGGTFITFPKEGDYSSSSIIAKIKSLL